VSFNVLTYTPPTLIHWKHLQIQRFHWSVREKTMVFSQFFNIVENDQLGYQNNTPHSGISSCQKPLVRDW